ncbi:MAG: sulfite exporter TauE/SafE family protein [bacterium]|nr:sulfite exporter TauE/SafE family protein [bacterium]
MGPLAASAFFAVALFASAMAAITGFGTAMVLLPFTTLFVALEPAIVLVAIFHFLSNASRLWFMRRHVHRRTAILYGAPSLVAAFGGAMLLTMLTGTRPLRLVFGLFLAAYAVSSLAGRSWRVPSSDRTLVVGGVLSGFTSGLIGLGGAIRSAFLISTPLSKEAYIGTSAAIAVAVDTARLSVYLPWGALPATLHWLVPPLVVCAFAGAWLGRRGLMRLPEATVRRVVMVLVLIVAIRFLLR